MERGEELMHRESEWEGKSRLQYLISNSWNSDGGAI